MATRERIVAAFAPQRVGLERRSSVLSGLPVRPPRRPPILVLLLASLIAAQSPAAEKKNPGAATTVQPPTISTSSIRAHIQFLADDLLEGRATATRGHEIAARYVASQMETIGLAPGGTSGTYLQAVPLRRVELVEKESSVTLLRNQGSVEMTSGRDYLIAPDALRERTEVRGPVVFAGFGITAPKLKHDDYADLETRGKIVLLLSGAPSSFPNDPRAYYSSRRTKTLNAALHGAVAILIVRTPVDEARQSWESQVKDSARPAMRWLEKEDLPADASPEIRAEVLLSRRGAEKLLQSSPITMDQLLGQAGFGKAQSFPLPIEIEIRQVSRHTRAESPNVVGILAGSDPKLRSEALVYTAHLDHLGMSEGGGDAIYNGAYDNASGVAILLEVARAWSRAPRPRRSIVFAAVTGEEKGLIGSDYLARNAPGNVGRIVADINLDSILMLYPVKEIVVHGAEHSTLGAVVERSAKQIGLSVVADPAPEEVRFIRSDQYSFVRKGIPAVSFKAGTRSGDPAVSGLALNKEWQRTIYHSTRDDLSQKFNFGVGVKFAQLAFLTGARVASETKPPSWKAGGFFGEKFAKD